MKSVRIRASVGGKGEKAARKGKSPLLAFGITQWIKETWVSGCRALWPRGAWERWEVLHLWIVLQLWRRLLNLARRCWLLLRWSVAVCNGLAVRSWICVRLGCLCDVFMYLIWEVSARQKFLMAWCNWKCKVLSVLKGSHEAPDSGVALSGGNTRPALLMWKGNSRKMWEGIFGAEPFTLTSFGLLLAEGCAITPVNASQSLESEGRGSTAQSLSCFVSETVAPWACWPGWQLSSSLRRYSSCILWQFVGNIWHSIWLTATENWEISKQPPGITKCHFRHLKPHFLQTATRAKPRVI